MKLVIFSVPKQATSFDTIYVGADFKNLLSLEVCGGFVTDAGVKNIKDLKALTLLNLSQNVNLTDKTLELISGIVLPMPEARNKFTFSFYSLSLMAIWFTGLTALVNLNVSNSRVSNAGLKHLNDLQNLRSLSLDSTRVTANEMRKLRATMLPNLISMRPE